MNCYEKWTIAISAISAIVTLFAIFVALWQTKYANKKKLKLSNTIVAQVVQDLSTGEIANSSDFFLYVKVVNIGNRKVILNDWGISFSKKMALQIASKSTKLFPCEIDVEQYKDLQTSLRGLRNALNNNQQLIKNKKRKLKIYVIDSTGKKYFTKLPNPIDYYMQLAEEQLTAKFSD